MFSNDHYVAEGRSSDALKYIAELLRQKNGIWSNWKTNLSDFILKRLVDLKGKKVHVLVEFLSEDHVKEAYVSFRPLKLHVKKTIWEGAQIWDPHSVHVLAHELGHLIMHDHTVKAFSSNPELLLRWTQEHSAEWQAERFAEHFLIPDNILNQMDGWCAMKISEALSVPLVLVQERLAQRNQERQRQVRIREAQIEDRISQNKELCPTCGNFAVPINKPTGPCDECGSMVSTHNDRVAF